MKKINIIVLVIAGIVILTCFAKQFFRDNTAKELKEAMYYIKLDRKAVQCELCPRKCTLNKGQRGYCGVRKNIDGRLYSLVYGKPVSIAVDPIEKKPVFHLLPGSLSFSIATVGCNMRCIHCQNWQISQVLPEEVRTYEFTPEEIVKEAIRSKSKSIAYTYTEPVVFYEYMYDIAKIARSEGIKNVMVTSGWINPEPFRKLCEYLDVARIDLKGFTEEFYHKLADASLKPVLETIKIAREEGVWVELINLIIPGYNDDMKKIKEMCEWIKDNVGTDVPIYFSRFFPQHRLKTVPPTSIKTLEKAREVALSVGINYAYIGNVGGHPGENTYCPECGEVVIGRVGYTITQNNIRNGKCRFCGMKIPGIWK